MSMKRKWAVFEEKEEFENYSFTYVLTNFMRKKTAFPANSCKTSYYPCQDPRLPGVRWKVQVFPCGDETVDDDYLIIYVGLKCSENTEVKADFVFEILNPEGLVLESKSDPESQTLGRKNGKAILCYVDGCFAHATIERDFLFDGHLTIRVNIRYRIISGEKLTASGVFLRSLQKQENSARSSDVVLVSSDNREFPAHKFVLSMQSDVFAAMFEHPLKEVETGRCVIEDLDGQTVEAMVKYMYGKDEWNPELAGKLVIAANKYKIDVLEKACVRELITQLNVEKVLDMCTFADCNNLAELKLKSVEFIAGNLQAFVAAGGLTRLHTAQSVQLMKDIEQLVQKQLAEVQE